MADTIFRQLHAAAYAALQGMPEATDGVHLDRASAFAAGTTAAVAVEPGDDQTEPYGEGTLRGRMALHVHIYTQGSPASQVVDPIEKAAHQRLMADPSFNGLCLRLMRVNGARQAANAEQQHGHRTVTYQADFLANEANLAPAS